MTRRLIVVGAWCTLIMSPVVIMFQLFSSDINSEDWQLFVQNGIITAQLIQFVSVCVVLFAWLLTMITLIQGIRIQRAKWHATDPMSLLSMYGIALAGFLSLGSSTTTGDIKTTSSGVDVHTLISPVIAGMSATHTMRRSQKNTPEILQGGVAVVIDRVSSECEWEVVVRLFGYPRVENRKGNSVDFRKRKALELLTWLSINRDRPLRSAARTAMWESNISDSSFATVVSDMRRCLSELCPHVSPRDWAPPTFTDDIVLSKKIVTDVELLRNAWQRFETDRSTFTEVVAELSRVRDLPFAGANYCWPDIDGSTTRFVMMGANIAREVAYWAYDNKKWDEVTIAATAGLRLLPGDEELLDLQRLVLQTSRSGLD
jgi:hypothetical protein